MAAPIRDEAIDAVYRRHVAAMTRLAYLMTGSRTDAEELANEAFLRLHERWDDVDEPVAYVRIVLVNLCSRWRRRAATKPDETRRSSDLVATDPEIDETWRLIEALPEHLRVVLVLRYYEDLPATDIAAALGCSPATVRTRVHRALRRLRKEMR